MHLDGVRNILKQNGLKITPQRMAVMEAFGSLYNHPKADQVIDFIRQNHPNIAVGTVYNTLDTFVDKGIVKRVKTEKDVMRYDSILENHHHLYCANTEKIADYFDNELNQVLTEYFSKKSIPGFEIENIQLQIKGKFTDK